MAIFREIALNIVNPLELIREAISNSIDAGSVNIEVILDRDDECNLIIILKDNGKGMDLSEIHKFFNLGDSQKNRGTIGQKGLGTKIYFKSKDIVVYTKKKNGIAYKVKMSNVWDTLLAGEIPIYVVNELDKIDMEQGTEVIIKGYKVDSYEKYFSFEVIKDYILWFTACGSFKNIFASNIVLQKIIPNMSITPVVHLKDKINNKEETFLGMHRFSEPNELPEVIDENEKYKKSINFSKSFGPFNRETIINEEYVSVQIFGTISGFNCRRELCKLRQGETYKNRYGLYLAKDFIAFSRQNQLLGDEQYYHYHIMANSQEFELTADRNNLSNVDDVKVKWVLEQIKDIVNRQIKPISERDYFQLRKNEEEEYITRKKFESIRKNLSSVENLDDLMIEEIPILKKPSYEFEVALLFASILTNKSTRRYIDKISKIMSYSTKAATDMICLDDENNKVLVEVEYMLSSTFKHRHPISTYDIVVCWKIDIEENKINEINEIKTLLINKDHKTYIVTEDNKQIEVIEMRRIVNNIIEDKVKKSI